MLGQISGNLGTQSRGQRRLVHDHAPTGALDRSHYTFLVQRDQCTQIDDVCLDALVRKHLGRSLDHRHAGAPGDQRDVVTVANGAQLTERHRVVARRHLTFDRAIAA